MNLKMNIPFRHIKKNKRRFSDLNTKIRDDRFFGITYKGIRKQNEDCWAGIRVADAYLLAVADGLGGWATGEIASKIAVDTLTDLFSAGYAEGMSQEEIKDLLLSLYKKAHKTIIKSATGDHSGMDTTLVSTVITGDSVIIANTGDSRAYIVNDVIKFRTRDQSPVQVLVDNGLITEDEAKKHPMRYLVDNVPGLSFDVDIYEQTLVSGDLLILTSDGVHDYISEDLLPDIVRRGMAVGGSADVAGLLFEKSLETSTDNVTIVVYSHE
ncbi:MAG: protein phosphatase 2C domain-containing protein [Euryarchaeota archaeon]|nr:protein phosphatase 2C domain-containing protein [Euryarchaeota archaeon]